MNVIIAVVVAFLANGDANYAAVDVHSTEECQAKVAEIAHERLIQNASEEVKVLGFSFKCVEFEVPPTSKPPHVPGKDEASAIH